MPGPRDMKAWLARADAELDAWAASGGVTQEDAEGSLRCLGLALEGRMAASGWEPFLALRACLKAARLVRGALDRARKGAVERGRGTKKTDRQGD